MEISSQNTKEKNFDMNLCAKMTDESKLNLTITRDRLWAPSNIPFFDKLGRLE